MKKILFVAVAATLFAAQSHAQTPLQQNHIPSCDAFMQRLRGACRALTVSLPLVKFERSPYSEKGTESFWVSYEFTKDIVFEGALDCVDGQFENYEMQAPTMTEHISMMSCALTISSPLVFTPIWVPLLGW